MLTNLTSYNEEAPEQQETPARSGAFPFLSLGNNCLPPFPPPHSHQRNNKEKKIIKKREIS